MLDRVTILPCISNHANVRNHVLLEFILEII